VWLLVTEKAKEVFLCGLFDLYILHFDDSESKVEGFGQLVEALENGLDIGIEVGFIHDSLLPRNAGSSQISLQKEIVNKAGINIVACGNCGDLMLHRLPADTISCISCEHEGDICNFPDLII
jgi:hypothetical protein